MRRLNYNNKNETLTYGEPEHVFYFKKKKKIKYEHMVLQDKYQQITEQLCLDNTWALMKYICILLLPELNEV